MTEYPKTAVFDRLGASPEGTEDPKQIKAALVKATNEVSRKFQAALSKQADKVMKQAEKAAKKYATDPLYVQYNLVRPTRFWPQMPPNLKKALEIAQFIVTDAGTVPSFGSMQVPPAHLEPSLDAALTDVAEWAQKKMIPDLRKQYYSIVERAARPHVRVLRRPDQTLPPLQDAASQVSGYFKYLLRSGRELSPLRLLMLRTVSAF